MVRPLGWDSQITPCKGERRRGDAGEAEQAGVEVGHDPASVALTADMVEGQEDGGGRRRIGS